MRDAPSDTARMKQDFRTNDTNNPNIKDFSNTETFTRSDGSVSAEQTVKGSVDVSDAGHPQFTTSEISRDYELKSPGYDSASFSLDGKDYQTNYNSDNKAYQTYSIDKDGNKSQTPVVTQKQSFKNGASDAAYEASKQLSNTKSSRFDASNNRKKKSNHDK